MIQKERGNPGASDSNEAQKIASPSQAPAPDPQKVLDSLNEGIEAMKLEVEKRRRKIKICHCGSRACGWGPFVEIEIEEDVK